MKKNISLPKIQNLLLKKSGVTFEQYLKFHKLFIVFFFLSLDIQVIPLEVNGVGLVSFGCSSIPNLSCGVFGCLGFVEKKGSTFPLQRTAVSALGSEEKDTGSGTVSSSGVWWMLKKSHIPLSKMSKKGVPTGSMALVYVSIFDLVDFYGKWW